MSTGLSHSTRVQRNPTPSAWITQDHSRYSQRLWHGISGSFLLPTLVRTSHLPTSCLLTPYMSCAICPNYIFFPQAFQTHATQETLPFPHSSTELHWCLQHLSETCIHIIQLPNLENYVLADFISSTKPTTWLTVQLNFWTDQVEDRGHRNNSQGKIMSLPILFQDLIIKVIKSVSLYEITPNATVPGLNHG